MKINKRIIGFLNERFSSFKLMHFDHKSYLFYAKKEKDCLIRILEIAMPSGVNASKDRLIIFSNIASFNSIIPIDNIEIHSEFIVFLYAYTPSVMLYNIISLFGNIPYKIAFAVLIQLLLCMNSLSSYNKNHSALTPCNIFIEDGLVRIMDYGLFDSMIFGSNIGKVYNQNLQFIPKKILAGEMPDRSSNIENIINIFMFMLDGSLTNYFTSGQLIEIINMDFRHGFYSEHANIHKMINDILNYNTDQSIISIVKCLLHSGIFYNSFSSKSGILSEIFYKTRKLLLDEKIYYKKA